MNLADQPPLEVLAKYRIVPIIALEDAAKAVPLSDALIAEGFADAEVKKRFITPGSPGRMARVFW